MSGDHRDLRVTPCFPTRRSSVVEGGAHQSVSTPLVGLAQDGLASLEPAFVDELSTILAWSFDYLQRDGEGRPTGPWLRDEKGGSVYLRLSTRPLEQPRRALEGDLAAALINGAYWLRPPAPNCQVAIAYQGVVAAQAIAPAGPTPHAPPTP